MPIDNEILSPVPIWIWVDPKTKKKHLTGGYGQPDMTKCLCSKKITGSTVLAVRDVWHGRQSVRGRHVQAHRQTVWGRQTWHW